MLKADDRAIYDSVMAPQRTALWVSGSATPESLDTARDLMASGLFITVNLRDGAQVKDTQAFLLTMADKYPGLGCGLTLRCVDPNDPHFDTPPADDAERQFLIDQAVGLIGCAGARKIGESDNHGGLWVQALGEIVSGDGEARPGDWPALLSLMDAIFTATVKAELMHVHWSGPALTRLELLDTNPSRLEGFGMDRRDLIEAVLQWCALHDSVALSVALECADGDAAYRTMGLIHERWSGSVTCPRWRPTGLQVSETTQEIMRDIFASGEAFGLEVAAYWPLAPADAEDASEAWWAATDGGAGPEGGRQPIYSTLKAIGTAAYKGT